MILILLSLQPRDREHFKHAVRDIPAQLFQQGVGAAFVQLGHDVADSIADPGQLAQPVLGDNAIERLDQRRERVRGAQISFGAEVIGAGERCAPAYFDQQRRDSRSVEGGHFSSAAAARPADSSSTSPSGRRPYWHLRAAPGRCHCISPSKITNGRLVSTFRIRRKPRFADKEERSKRRQPTSNSLHKLAYAVPHGVLGNSAPVREAVTHV